ncbi:MAG: threonylcarbamoyl-AMP synthase [Muribaculaceae bacterium]|nr:threonylcarbamoyl-AMP synthase [Muribaculaceae bacterium]
MTLQNDISKAVSVMKRGGVILYPTDTVWGIGCDATSSDAVRRVYEIKRRSDSKALISLVSDIDMLERFVGNVPLSVADFLEKSDRPTTVVYPSCRLLAPELLADDGSAGIRVTSEIYSRGLCQELGVPVVSTSANISGEPAPALFSEISDEIISAVDYVADFRRDDSTVSAPSRVVKLNSDGSFIILRP